MYAYPCMQNTEETIAKYAVDDNLFRLGSTNPKKKYPHPGCILVGGFAKEIQNFDFFFQKCLNISRALILFLGLVDPSRNRLDAHIKFFFFKSGQNCMQDAGGMC